MCKLGLKWYIFLWSLANGPCHHSCPSRSWEQVPIFSARRAAVVWFVCGFFHAYFTSSSVVLIILAQGGKTFAVRFLSVKTVSVKQNCRCHSLQVKGAGQRNTILVLTPVYTTFLKLLCNKMQTHHIDCWSCRKMSSFVSYRKQQFSPLPSSPSTPRIAKISKFSNSTSVPSQPL